MRFISLTIKEGLVSYPEFKFSSGINIVFSKKNSVGKTSLLRFLMYALGYQIPNIRDLKFDSYELDLEISDEGGNICHIQREGDYITFKRNSETYSFSLPFDLHELHTKIFGINNIDILDNLLGAYYIDQEKGWTLLNRGKAIGRIKFNIEGLVRGLSGRSCDELINKARAIEHELKKYKYMFNVAQYQKDIHELGESIAYDTPVEEIEKKLSALYCERQPIFDELERIKNVIRKNTSFKHYISAMKLMVQSKNGEEIPVNEDTIIGFRDNTEYLSAKRKMVSAQLADIDRKIHILQQRQENENMLFNTQTRIQSFDADISKIKIDAVSIQNIIKRLEKEYATLNNMINNAVKQNNPIIDELHRLIVSYAVALGLSEMYVRPYKDYIFTNDLKSLSGAIFHKIVFSFKMSYIKIIFNHTGVRLPVILDSPSGREVDEINIADMMKILARDFTDHQIIIASIHTYKDFPTANIIELKERLLSSTDQGII